MTKYYAVIDSHVGCLPESDHGIFTSKADAVADAYDTARDYREAGFKVSGSKRKAVWYVEEQGRYIEVADISNQVRPCSACNGIGDAGKGWCYACDDSGLETF